MSLAGTCLYIASGGLCINNNLRAQGDRYAIAMALASFAIITGMTIDKHLNDLQHQVIKKTLENSGFLFISGIVLLLDAAFMIFKFARKEK